MTIFINPETFNGQNARENQKKFYKDGAKSICKECTNYNNDCFEAMKYCGKDEKTGFSKVERCSDFKKK